MRVATSYSNYARGKIDHDLMGRFDLPIYLSGSDIFRNWISNFKGNAIYRAGLESFLAYQDCALTEFKFSNTQNYIVVMTANKMRFVSYDANGTFGWVLDGSSNILEIATPYSLAQSKYLCQGKPAQNQDVMIFTHFSFEPYKLTRVSSNNFTFQVYSRKDDPFPKTWAGTKVITGITQAVNAVVTSAAHGYVTGDRVLFAGVVGMTQINGYTGAVTLINANSYSVDIDTTAFTAYSSGGTSAKVLTGDYPDNALFYKGRLDYSTTPLKTTTMWLSQSGNYYIHTIPTGSTTATDALQITIADITQRIEWLFAGDNSLIAGSADGIVAVNGGGVNTPITASTVEASITSADGCNRVYPIRKDGLVFYMGINDRNMYYFSYSILTESFKADDANITSYDITIGGFGTKMRYKKDRNDLIYSIRNALDICTLNFKNLGQEQIVGWHELTSDTPAVISDIACITDNNGAPQMFAVAFRNGQYFIEHQADYVEFKHRTDFFTGTSAAAELADDKAYNRYISEQLRSCVYLDNCLSYSDYRTATITYDPIGGTISSSAASFLVGDVGKHIVYKTLTGYESGRFLITGFTSTAIVTVAVLQTPTANVYASWYLSFTTITGLSQYNGMTVSFVTDGGYLRDDVISGGTYTFAKQITSVKIGYRYKGVIKSFCLGFLAQSTNTQNLLKALFRATLRMATSVGLKFGTSLYTLEEVHDRTPNDINYLPALPMDGTKTITYGDDTEEDKFYYVVQDEPGPATICATMIEAEYAVEP